MNCFVAQLTINNQNGAPQHVWVETPLSLQEIADALARDGVIVLTKLRVEKNIERKQYIRGRMPILLSKAGVATMLPAPPPPDPKARDAAAA